MKKQYTKKQIQEAIKRWKSVLESMNEQDDAREDEIISNKKIIESEDLFGSVNGIMTFAARDLIFENSPKDIKVEEVPYMSDIFSPRLHDFSSFTKDEIDSIKKTYSVANGDAYRIMKYSAFYDAHYETNGEVIEDEGDYKDFIDRDSRDWEYSSDEEYHEVVDPFIEKFPTYSDFLKYRGDKSKDILIDAFHDSDQLPYSSIEKDDIKINEYGAAYILIAWRA